MIGAARNEIKKAHSEVYQGHFIVLPKITIEGGRVQRSYISVNVYTCASSLHMQLCAREFHTRGIYTNCAGRARDTRETLSCMRASRFDLYTIPAVPIISNIAKSDGMSCRVLLRNNKLSLPKTRGILIGDELKFFSRAHDVIVLILAKVLHDIFALNERDMRKYFAIVQVIKENVRQDAIENRTRDMSYYII